MKLAGVVSSLLVVASLFGCEVGETRSEEPVDQAQQGLLKGIIYWCIRDRPDLPDGHNIDSWLIACLGGGGEVICNADTPMCCKNDHCSDDPSDVVRGAADPGTDTGGDEVTAEPGKPPAVAGDTKTPSELAPEAGESKEPEVGELARDKGADLEKCLHSCPTDPGRVEVCRRNCMCRTGHRPMSDCDLIDLFQ